MLLGVTATVVATCFCLSPTPLPEQVPVAPDAFTATTIRDEVPADAIPERCLNTARAWSHLAVTCPKMRTLTPAPTDPFIHVGARPLLLGRVR